MRPAARGATVVRLRLARRGAGRSRCGNAYGLTPARTVEARAGARLRLLVTGDSLVYGIFEDLRSVLGARALVRGDPNPATGISKPIGLDWVAHAKAIGASARPDVTVVFPRRQRGLRAEERHERAASTAAGPTGAPSTRAASRR